MPWPPGLDLGPATVEATLTPDRDGRIVGVDWSGPPELVAAVAPTIGLCRVDRSERVRWDFPEAPVNVAGVVRSRGENGPVELIVLIADRVVRSDPEGRFALRNVAPGTWTVRLAPGAWRLPEEIEVTVGVDQRVELALSVERDRLGGDEIVGRYSGSGPSALVHTVDLERASAVPGTLGDPLRALTTETGLARSPYNAGWLLVRGGEFDDVGLYLDGVRVPLIYHLGGFTTVLHPELVEEVRFWPGLFPARYGDAISGAVDLVPRPLGGDTRVLAGANLVFLSAYTEVPTRSGGIAVAARRSVLDGILGLVLGSQGAQIAPRFWDVSARATLGDASVTLVGASDRSYAPGELDTLLIEQQVLQVQARLPLGSAFSARPWLAFSQMELTDLDRQVIGEWYPGLRLEGRADAGPTGRLIGGIEGQRRSFRMLLDDLDPKSADVERRVPVWTVDPYAGASVGDRVEGWSEVRLSAAVVQDPAWPARTAWSPRAGLRWRIAEGLVVHGELGRLAQTPLPTLWLAVRDGAYLGFEQSDQLAGGLTLTRGPVAFAADGWTRRTWDLAEVELDGSIGAGYGRAHGLETRLGFVRGGFDGTVLYQLTRADRREDPGDPWAPSAFDAPHRLEVLLIGHLPRAQVVSARLRHTSGYARVEDPVLGILPTRAYDLLDGRSEPLGLDPGDDRLQGLSTLDVRYGRLFEFDGWQLEASLEVQNLLDARVAEPVIAGFGESPIPNYGIGWPILPILSVEGRFFP